MLPPWSPLVPACLHVRIGVLTPLLIFSPLSFEMIFLTSPFLVVFYYTIELACFILSRSLFRLVPLPAGC